MIRSSDRLVSFCCVLPIIALFLIAPEAAFPSAYASEPLQSEAIEDLWIDMSIGPPLVPLFNAAAREE